LGPTLSLPGALPIWMSAPRPVARSLLPHHLDDDPLGAPAVPFAVEDPLPRAKVEAAVSYRNDHFVADRKAAEVGGAVVLARPVVDRKSTRLNSSHVQ